MNRLEYDRRDQGRSTYALIGVRSETKHAYHHMKLRLESKLTEYREVTKEDFLFKYWV